MNKFHAYVIVPLLSLAMAGCSAEDDNTVNTQQDNIISYLENNADTDDWREPISGNVYRYVVESEGIRDNSTRIQKGDSVYFRFAAYQFTTRRVEPAFYTNIDYIINELREEELNTIFFSREAEKVEIGKSKLIKPIELGLTDCHKGDSVMIFLTKDMAFGANYIMSLPPDSAVEYAFIIDEVKKQ